MKIILAGCGKVGSTLVKELTAEGHDLTVIDQNGAVMESLMESYDIIGVQGNSAAMSVLEDANVQETQLLIAVTEKRTKEEIDRFVEALPLAHGIG